MEYYGDAREAEGREKGREEMLISNIKNMMKSLGLSLQKALDALGITDSEKCTRIAGMIR